MIVIVKKKNDQLRFCVNYKPLNDITKKDNYPLPRINEILDSLNGAQWFTTLDLASGYWQIKVKAEDQEKTAFITKFGTYEFKVMPFGLCNAPATFQRTMDKAEKCHFGAKELQFLGHVVGEEGIKPDPEKIDKIVNYPIPANIRNLRDASLIGIGAVLAQKDGKDEYVIAYASRTLAPAEKNYAITELEYLAIIWTVKYFRHYLFGIHFTIITDHSVLKWLLNSSSETANRQLKRWKITLSEYDYEIQYRKGTKHSNADALSRINPNTAKIRCTSAHYILQNNLLYRRTQDGFKRVILREQVESILYHLHQNLNAAHLGIDAVFEKVKECYYWPQMFEDIRNYINTCDTC
ncbi:putative integrase core domain protein [Rhizophagus clarus]|uniref:Putative integrase core domain protein n=1 Tax=Rhizophagus clarus TaxID=94130 RepID=A0A8H3LNS4_9GLOM|nr:putative integrase core domain protein [Rhizophagus clarus]